MELLAHQLVDETDGQVQLAVLELDGLPPVDVVEIANLVGVVHGVEHEPALDRADQHQPFLAAHDVLGETDPVGLGHGVRQQAIGLVATLVGTQVVCLLEVDRVDLFQRHELFKLDDLGGLLFKGLELVVLETDVLVLGELVAADQVRSLHDLVAHRAELLLLQARAASVVQEIERDAADDAAV